MGQGQPKGQTSRSPGQQRDLGISFDSLRGNVEVKGNMGQGPPKGGLMSTSSCIFCYFQLVHL